MVCRGPPLVWAIKSSRHGDVACQIPDEAGEFSSNGGADLVLMQTACAQAPIALAEAQLRSPGDLAQDSRLGFIADLHIAGNLCREAIRPGRLDQDATGVRVAGFGNSAERTRFPGGAFARYETEECHKLFGVRESV